MDKTLRHKPLVTHLWMVEMLGRDHGAALLLNQMVYWYVNMKQKAYWKYIEPPMGDYPKNAYKEGESWCEELGMSRRQFEWSRDKVATAVARPAGMLTSKFDEDGDLLPVERIVIYWKITNNQTKYAVNMPLLYEYQRIWAGESQPLGTVDMQGFEVIVPERESLRLPENVNPIPQKCESDSTKMSNPNTENTQENTTAISTPEARALFLAIAEVHKGYREKDVMPEMVKDDVLGYMEILKNLGGFTAAEVREFPVWYREANPRKSMPKKPETFEFYYMKYRQSMVANREAEDKEAARDTDLWARRANMVIS